MPTPRIKVGRNRNTSQLPPGSVFDLYGDGTGWTNTGGVLTQWQDPNHPAVTLTVPGGKTGPAIAGKIQGYQKIAWNGNALSNAALSLFSPGQARTLAAVVSTNDAGPALATPMSFGTTTPLNAICIAGAGSNGHGFSYSDGVTNSDAYTGTDGTFVRTDAPMVAIWMLTPGSGGATLRINGFVVPGQTGTSQVSGENGFMVGNRPDYAGAPLIGTGQQFHGYPRICSEADLEALEGVLAQKYNIVGVNRWMSDSLNYCVFAGAGNLHAPLAAHRFQTTATSIVLTAINTSGSATIAQLTVIVDGGAPQYFALTAASTPQSFTLNLDGNAHVVEVWDGAAWNAGLTGTALMQIQDDSGKTVLLPMASTSERTVVYGDSISLGAYATNYDGGLQKLRRGAVAWGGRMSFLGGNGRQLHHDYANDPTFTVLANQLKAMLAEVAPGGVQRLIIQVSTNDYNQSAWPDVATFQNAYQTLVGRCQLTMPSTTRILVQGTGVTSNDNALNTSATPFSIAQTRAAVQAATAAASAGNGATNTTYFDPTVSVGGQACYTSAQLNGDGLHPNDAGHAAYAAWWSAIRAMGN